MSDPKNDDALDRTTGQGTQEHQNTQHVDDTGADASRKSFATLKAKFALAGFGLIELADGSYLATRWNCCRALPDLHAASTFYRQIGGQA